jgi:asparagine synthetase B (glutamine-hydrolysing)
LIREAAGVATLYYYRTPEWMAFSTDLGSLLAAAQAATDLDYLARYFARVPSEGHTIYRDIRAGAPGEVVSFDARPAVISDGVAGGGRGPDRLQE